MQQNLAVNCNAQMQYITKLKIAKKKLKVTCAKGKEHRLNIVMKISVL